jgi:hypothetical protein
MATVRELKSTEFTERLEPIFRSVESRLPEHLRGRKAEYFFPHWRRLMELGVARTWEIPDAVLGMLITPDIFSGTSVAHIPFWFKLAGSKSPAKLLLKAAEEAAKKSGCVRLSIAAFSGLEFERMVFFYLGEKYQMTESTFQKELK